MSPGVAPFRSRQHLGNHPESAERPARGNGEGATIARVVLARSCASRISYSARSFERASAELLHIDARGAFERGERGEGEVWVVRRPHETLGSEKVSEPLQIAGLEL